MFKLVFDLIKLCFFTAFVLLLGSIIEWDGKTLSDHVKTQVNSSKKLHWYHDAKSWANSVIQDLKNDHSGKNQESDADRLSPSERQKLRALIKELNGAIENN